ncbi:hypothetical protein IWW46_006469 [Coemansia sp. RSA 2440]|nr:hypothetical protein IWW46_006469 [Coemansia sp. RSA 2440]
MPINGSVPSARRHSVWYACWLWMSRTDGVASNVGCEWNQPTTWRCVALNTRRASTSDAGSISHSVVVLVLLHGNAISTSTVRVAGLNCPPSSPMISVYIRCACRSISTSAPAAMRTANGASPAPNARHGISRNSLLDTRPFPRCRRRLRRVPSLLPPESL